MTENGSRGFFLVRLWRRLVEFLGEVRAEMTKVAWPSRQEIVASTWVVVFAVACVAVWIFVTDRVSSFLMTTLRGLFG